MYLDLLKNFNSIAIDEIERPLFEEPVSEKDIDHFINESQIALQYTPCDEYLNLLRLTNGFEWNSTIFNIVDFLYENIENRKVSDEYKKFILFGSSGSTAHYTYNIEDKTFNIANMMELDAVFDKYDSFGDLIVGVLKECDEELFMQAFI